MGACRGSMTLTSAESPRLMSGGSLNALAGAFRRVRDAAPHNLESFVITVAVVVGLLVGALSCARALAAGVEHDEHSGSLVHSTGLLADVTVSVIGLAPIAVTGHHGHSSSRSVVNTTDSQDSQPTPDAPSSVSVGFDMMCAAVTELRVPDPIVSLVQHPIWYGFDAVPSGCTVEPDPPVPKA